MWTAKTKIMDGRLGNPQNFWRFSLDIADFLQYLKQIQGLRLFSSPEL